jgi:hypothetical protein
VTAETCATEEAESSGRRVRPRQSGGTALSCWFAMFAGYAAVVAIVTHGPSRSWGAWAAAAYALAAATA